jgi:chorismate mutase/prephenate dehydratase
MNYVEHVTEEQTSVAFLGPEGTFSHQAATALFKNNGEFHPCDSIEDIFTVTESLQCRYGLVPVENSAQGSVTVTMDCCIRTRLNICGEFLLPVRQMLLSNAESTQAITHIYSHPQPLLQCRAWLLKNVPGITQEAVSSTAEAARRALADPQAAAIGGPMLAELYNLNVLHDGIQDARNNTTRFWILGPSAAAATGSDKTSIWFITPHRPGALYHVLKVFSDTDVNITRIESRPYPGKSWEYVFFLDIEGHIEAENIQAALPRLAACVDQYRVLGSYPAA